MHEAIRPMRRSPNCTYRGAPGRGANGRQSESAYQEEIMKTGRHHPRTRGRSLFFGAALMVALGVAQMGTATAQEEPTPPDLQVTKSSSLGGTFDESEHVTYTLTVTNVGETDAEDVEMHDDLPGGMNPPPLPTFKGEPCS